MSGNFFVKWFFVRLLNGEKTKGDIATCQRALFLKV